ncbi:MAG TPA: glycosyltransferase family 87 protein [Chthoniobacterales bacterium]|nr:glycosyltransferase family 87 protein [Chthoniobacterales bacterium]
MNRPTTWRVVLWIFGAVLFVFVAVPVWHSLRGHSTKDYWVWFETGQTVLQGGAIYPDQWHKFAFMYPPPCALFLAPISALGQTGLVVVLALVNAAAWICCILFSVRLVTGKWQGAPVLLYAVPSLIVGAFVWGNFLLGQPSLVLLALMLGAFIALQRRFHWLAGALIAIAAAIKAFPVIALVYLIYRRSWIATASLVLTLTFFLLVLPLPFRGPGLLRQDLERWSTGMLFKYDESGVGQRLGRSTSWKNQSIWGVANRLLRHVEYDHKYEPHEPVYANFADLDFRTVNAIILAAALGLGLCFITVMPRRARRTSETDAMEFALLLLLMLIFTPLSFGYLFVWLLYPFTVVLERLQHGSASHRALLGWAGAALALLAFTIPFRVTAQVYGNMLFAAVLLFAGLAAELWARKTTGAG